MASDLTPTPASKTSSYWQQTLQNRMLVVVLVMVVLVPLLAFPSNVVMQNIAMIALRLMAALLAGILVLRARVAAGRAEIAAFLKTGANAPVLLFFLASLASIRFANPTLRYLGLVDMMRVLTGTLLYFAIAYHIRRSEHLVKIRDGLTLVTAIMAVMGFVAFDWNASSNYLVVFGNHQLFSAFVMILFPMTLVGALTETNVPRQLIAQITSAVAVLCLLLSGTHSAWLGAFVEVFVLLFLSRLRTRRGSAVRVQNKQYLLPLGVLVLCAIALPAIVSLSDLAVDPLVQVARRRENAYPVQLRLAASRMIADAPVFGHGLGSFEALYHHYSPKTLPPSPDLRQAGSLGENAHSFWLQTAAEQGIVGAGLFAAILIAFFIAGYRRLGRMDNGIRRTLLLGCLSAVAGFAVDAAANPAWQFGQVAMFFWLLLGLGVACLRPRSSR